MDIGVQKIVDRIAEFFTIFDFSYFISGITTLAVICYGLWETNLFIPFNNAFYNVIGCIIASYVCGLLSFVVGKYLRKKYIDKQEKCGMSRFMYCFTEAMSYVKKQEYKKEDYRNDVDCKIFYTEMWMHLRQNKEAAPTLAFLNKYWVLQAIYEGLMASSLAGIIVGGLLIGLEDFHFIYVIIIVFSAVSFKACRYEATRYAETQITEVVLAYHHFN